MRPSPVVETTTRLPPSVWGDGAPIRRGVRQRPVASSVAAHAWPPRATNDTNAAMALRPGPMGTAAAPGERSAGCAAVRANFIGRPRGQIGRVTSWEEREIQDATTVPSGPEASRGPTAAQHETRYDRPNALAPRGEARR